MARQRSAGPLLWLWRATLLSTLLLSLWHTLQPPCVNCAIVLVALDGPSGPVRGALYVPQRGSGPRPGILVLHGFLANREFMEVPWTQDLLDLGAVVLFVDRQGHGSSAGHFWPLSSASQHLDALYPDVDAALRFMHSRPDLIDPQRIAILGHSDGGTAAIVAAAKDWTVRATVALSASVAPWEFVNHIAPLNLLLLYGADDAFVLHNTDRLLFQRGTRGFSMTPASTARWRMARRGA